MSEKEKQEKTAIKKIRLFYRKTKNILKKLKCFLKSFKKKKQKNLQKQKVFREDSLLIREALGFNP